MGTVNLRIFVSDIAGVLGSYNVIRVRRSITGDSGPWSELTAAAPTAATLLAPTTGNYDVVGKTLTLKIDSGVDTDVVFTGVGQLTTAQVVNQVNAVIAGIASDDGNALRLTSTLLGTQSKVEIVGGGAVADFGWSDGDRDIGEEVYELLVAGTTVYYFTDNDGEPDYYYQAAFYHTTTGLISAWSDPFLGDTGSVIDAANLSIGTVDLVDASGVSVEGQEITFYSQHEPIQVQGYQVALLRSPITITTNTSGHAEISLVRGLKVKVVFEGTSLIRDITIPDAATFDLLDLLANATDPHDVVEPLYPDAIRRTL